MGVRRTVHDALAEARSRYARVTAVDAWRAVARGALLVDVRDGDQRRRDGAIPGALVIDRTVLEWRVDPDSGATHPEISGLDAPLMLICNEGYSSSLAVASLLDLGATAVTDVIGGFQAWLAAGLPVDEPVGAVGGEGVGVVVAGQPVVHADDAGPDHELGRQRRVRSRTGSPAGLG